MARAAVPVTSCLTAAASHAVPRWVAKIPDGAVKPCWHDESITGHWCGLANLLNPSVPTQEGQAACGKCKVEEYELLFSCWASYGWGHVRTHTPPGATAKTVHHFYFNKDPPSFINATDAGAMAFKNECASVRSAGASLPLNHTIIPASVTAHRRLAEHLESLKSQLPKAAPFPFTQFAAKVHTLLTSTLLSSSVAQSCIRTATLKSFQHTFPELLPVRVDKYPLLYAVATIVTFYRLILYVFTQAVNYRHLFTCLSPTRARNVLLLYYNLCVRVYPEILNHLSPLRLRNTLSLQVPTLKGISIKTPLLPVPSHPITPHTLCTVKNILLHDAQQQMHLTDNILYAPPMYPYGHRHTKQVFPPSVILSIKGKSLRTNRPSPLLMLPPGKFLVMVPIPGNAIPALLVVRLRLHAVFFKVLSFLYKSLHSNS